MVWGISDTTLILATAVLLFAVLAGRGKFITRELISFTGLALTAGLIATENHVAVALILAGMTLARIGLERTHPGTSALLLGLAGVAGAFLGQRITPGTTIDIALDGMTFVHLSLKPIAFFAALQLILLNPRIELACAKTTGQARPPGAGLAFSIAGIAVVLAFCFGLATGGITVDPQKLAALPELTARFIALIAAHALLVALIEESLFRGAVQPLARAWLTRRMPAHYAEATAVLVAAILFGLVHFKLGPAWMIGATIGGIGYGYAYATRRRLLAPVFIHALVVVVLTLGMING
ncbi:hypothetical protein A9404_01665 [Halothiobacillus diazotrophicus]|uniref:CAAX prenyl protease 2/Lysostaphin resistance protein A-like domain-containing protein n=1 Tax=Halothiobacillus diazotrophicus TaxID=1860122 RepID=A0A191ZEG0_9GAMM|nr:CPBP family intramembrane glutamic endopeptidase [Halothiobacillus diazotrophicus]ANJ66254.1 hypothetical protein A9404_01665 [Halothiobacillus diazotrophicus]